MKAALAFQVKKYINCEDIKKKEVDYIERALARLIKNSNIWVLGNTKAERQPILSFLVYSNARDKPLNGAFVATLLNDLFGIQARGGCACAGPYAHFLLGIDEPRSHAIKSAVKMVRVIFLHSSILNMNIFITFSINDIRDIMDQSLVGQE